MGVFMNGSISKFDRFFMYLNAIATFIIAICMLYYSYQHYNDQRTIHEPFFNVKIIEKFDNTLREWANEELVITNDGGHARNVMVRIYTFFKVKDYNRIFTYEDFLVPAIYYNTSITTRDSQGRIQRRFGHQNRSTLLNFVRELRESGRSLSISVVTYSVIDYKTITGKDKRIFFRNEDEIDRLPDFISEDSYLAKGVVDVYKLSYDIILKFVNENNVIPIPD
jgi:hypothetical protein